MMKKALALLTALCLLLSIPVLGTAAQMEKGVPVWTEETVQQYLTDYIKGKSMDRLYGYYDLQIRRYLAPESFEAFLLDLAFLTGDFQCFGSYRSFEEPEQKLKTHVQQECRSEKVGGLSTRQKA